MFRSFMCPQVSCLNQYHPPLCYSVLKPLASQPHSPEQTALSLASETLQMLFFPPGALAFAYVAMWCVSSALLCCHVTCLDQWDLSRRDVCKFWKDVLRMVRVLPWLLFSASVVVEAFVFLSPQHTGKVYNASSVFECAVHQRCLLQTVGCRSQVLPQTTRKIGSAIRKW